MVAATQSLDPKICLDHNQIHAIASSQIDCEKCHLDLKTISDAYDANLKQTHPKLQIWQQPTFIIAGFGVTFGVGALFIGTKCFGLCK